MLINAVGYQGKPISEVIFVGSAFEKVDGLDNFKIGDLQTNCGETEETSGSGWVERGDAVILLTETGSFDKKLVYVPQWIADAFNEDDSTPGYPVQKGWYDDEEVSDDSFTVCYNNEPIPFGSAIQVTATGTGAQITFSGAVKKTPTFIDAAGLMSVANCAAKTLKIGDLKVNCGETEETSGTGWVERGDAVVILTETGSFDKKLVYVPQWIADAFNEDDSTPGYPVQKGWYDEEEVSDDSFTHCFNEEIVWEGGDGFQITATGTDATIQIDPAVVE